MKVEVYSKWIGVKDENMQANGYEALTTVKTSKHVGTIEFERIDEIRLGSEVVQMAVVDGQQWALRDAVRRFAI